MVSTPLTTNRFSEALDPSMERPPSLRLQVRAGRQLDERSEIAALGQQVNRVLTEAEATGALSRVDEGRGSRHAHFFDQPRHVEHEREPLDLPEENLHALEPDRGETGHGRRYVVVAGASAGKRKVPVASLMVDTAARCETFSATIVAPAAPALPVLHRAFHGSALLLGRRRPGQQGGHQQCRVEKQAHVWPFRTGRWA